MLLESCFFPISPQYRGPFVHLLAFFYVFSLIFLKPEVLEKITVKRGWLSYGWASSDFPTHVAAIFPDGPDLTIFPDLDDGFT